MSLDPYLIIEQLIDAKVIGTGLFPMYDCWIFLSFEELIVLGPAQISELLQSSQPLQLAHLAQLLGRGKCCHIFERVCVSSTATGTSNVPDLSDQVCLESTKSK